MNVYIMYVCKASISWIRLARLPKMTLLGDEHGNFL